MKRKLRQKGSQKMKGITRFSNSLMEKYLPDPFLFVIILTLVIFVMGLGLTDSSPVQMVAFWGEGFEPFPNFV